MTQRSDRRRLRRGCQRLYSLVRPVTEGAGGSGPHLFLLEAPSRARRRPENLQTAIGAKGDEDVWLELAFYPGGTGRRRTLNRLWADPRIARLARNVERLNLRRRRAWSLATGTAQLE